MCIVAENGGQRMVGHGEKESKLEQEVPERVESRSEGGGGWLRMQSLL